MSTVLGIGVKTDPIQARYSFEWLCRILREEEVQYVQLGSFFELYWLDDGYFHELRRTAERFGLRIKSQFTAHRELGGFFYDDPHMEKAARRACERFIRVAGLLGVDYCGWNPGAVYRDRMETKQDGIDLFVRHLNELQGYAHEHGLRALSLEPMSCLAEYPTLPDEITTLMSRLAAVHRRNPDSTVPVRLCGDISHGYVDAAGEIVHDNWSLFEHAVPMMNEFHIRNTDDRFKSTFGFSKDGTGAVDLRRFRRLLVRNAGRWPVDDVVGYLEMPGPKLGRDNTDMRLESELRASISAVRGALSGISLQTPERVTSTSPAG